MSEMLRVTGVSVLAARGPGHFLATSFYTATPKAAGHRRIRLSPLISLQTSGFQSDSYLGADFAKSKHFITGLSVPF